MISIDFSIYEQLPNLAEVKTPSIYLSNKTEKFHPEGLFSEQIFGPVKNYKCQCGKTFGKINEGKRCEECGVLCAHSSLRTKTFAKIKLPQGIYIINPDFLGTIEQIFGPFAIKNILNVKKLQENKEFPYYFSLEKMKLLKESKMKENEKIIQQPVFDITTLKKVFDILIEEPETKQFIESKVFSPAILKYFFLNEIIVIPPESRPVVKPGAKTVIHKITALYQKLLNSKKNISDSLYQENSDIFGYTVYKYQEKINEIYEELGETNFRKKTSYMRESMAGKTIEFSQRAVIVPNPALKPYAIGLHKESVEKLFLPEMLKFLYDKFDDNDIDNIGINVIEFFQTIYNFIGNSEKIKIPDELFIEFLKKHMSEFRVIIERQPTLWKYNLIGALLERVYGDNDLFIERGEEDV
jgi:DNA-directed RNA polymerase subunit beta'